MLPVHRQPQTATNSACVTSTLPHFMQAFLVCTPQNVADYGVKLQKRTDEFRMIHQALYLGGDGLVAFSDPRLVNYW